MKVLKLHNKLVVGLGKGAVSDGEALSEEVTVILQPGRDLQQV